MSKQDPTPRPQEFSHPVESLALTVEEVVERFLQDKELFSSLKRGKVRLGCPWCRAGTVLNHGESPESYLVLG